jgi:hypothetical protein
MIIPSKNTLEYTSPYAKDPNACKSPSFESTLKKSSFLIGNAFQTPVNQYETSNKINLNEVTEAAKHRRTLSLNDKRITQLYNKGEGKYVSENLAGFTYKVNELSPKELKEAKNVVYKIKKHNWDNGSEKVPFDTTNNRYFKFDINKAKNANLPLSEEYKKNLIESNCDFGKAKAPLISTQLNSYIAHDNFQKVKSITRLKNSSIDFNPHFQNINRNSLYSIDY